MKNLKRILAIAGVALILLMYALTLVFALSKNENSRGMFFASLACTIIVPIILYAFELLAKAARPRKSPVVDSIVFVPEGVLTDGTDCEPYDDAFLAGLKQGGYGTYFLSALPQESLSRAETDAKVPLTKYADQTAYLSGPEKENPDPDAIRHHLDAWHLNPGRCVLISRSENLVNAAKKAGCAGIRFTDYSGCVRLLNALGVR